MATLFSYGWGFFFKGNWLNSLNGILLRTHIHSNCIISIDYNFNSFCRPVKFFRLCVCVHWEIRFYILTFMWELCKILTVSNWIFICLSMKKTSYFVGSGSSTLLLRLLWRCLVAWFSVEFCDIIFLYDKVSFIWGICINFIPLFNF